MSLFLLKFSGEAITFLIVETKPINIQPSQLFRAFSFVLSTFAFDIANELFQLLAFAL
jgi:hypothetical protein